MAIPKDLFILAMDAYNRGYGQGVNISGATLGGATIAHQSDTEVGSPGVNAGFYAIAYTTTADIGAPESGGVIPAGTTAIS